MQPRHYCRLIITRGVLPAGREAKILAHDVAIRTGFERITVRSWCASPIAGDAHNTSKVHRARRQKGSPRRARE